MRDRCRRPPVARPVAPRPRLKPLLLHAVPPPPAPSPVAARLHSGYDARSRRRTCRRPQAFDRLAMQPPGESPRIALYKPHGQRPDVAIFDHPERLVGTAGVLCRVWDAAFGRRRSSSSFRLSSSRYSKSAVFRLRCSCANSARSGCPSLCNCKTSFSCRAISRRAASMIRSNGCRSEFTKSQRRFLRHVPH
jgi:hypothetical protein